MEIQLLSTSSAVGIHSLLVRPCYLAAGLTLLVEPGTAVGVPTLLEPADESFFRTV